MPVVLDLYQGAYGPTLRIDTHDLEQLLRVINLFEALASRTVEEADFLRLVAPEIGGVSDLLMSCVSEPQEKTLFVGSVGPQGADLRWRGTPDYWQECLEKAQVLVAVGKPGHKYLTAKGGHQYLTIEGVDDALVELCYLETQP